jgi:hypothetical protein
MPGTPRLSTTPTPSPPHNNNHPARPSSRTTTRATALPTTPRDPTIHHCPRGDLGHANAAPPHHGTPTGGGVARSRPPGGRVAWTKQAIVLAATQGEAFTSTGSMTPANKRPPRFVSVQALGHLRVHLGELHPVLNLRATLTRFREVSSLVTCNDACSTSRFREASPRQADPASRWAENRPYLLPPNSSRNYPTA